MELLRPLMDSQFGGKSVAYTTSAGTTSAWPAGPQGVMVWCTSDAYVIVGEDATATSAATPIPANTPIPFYLPQPGADGTGAPWRVSAMQITTAGTLYAKPINIR